MNKIFIAMSRKINISFIISQMTVQHVLHVIDIDLQTETLFLSLQKWQTFYITKF